jgi:hypothetical protein
MNCNRNDPKVKRRVVFRIKLGLVIASGVLIACVAWGLAVRAANRAPSPTPAVARPEMARVTTPKPQNPPAGQPEVEHIILTPFGFEPAQITRPAGEFQLTVANRSPVSDIDLHLNQMSDGALVRQQTMASQQVDWGDFFNLKPGNYVLTESTHPDWTCSITITP